MRPKGENLGFTTMEIEGIRYAHLGSTSQIMGYADPSGLQKLMSTYQIMTPKIGWYGVEVRPRIREIFGLNPKVGATQDVIHLADIFFLLLIARPVFSPITS